MATIALKGMRFHSFHGYYTEEQSVGNNYEIDVTIVTNISMHDLQDDLHNTINYEMVYKICKTQMEIPRHLIETVAHEILQGIRSKIEIAGTCKVSIRKLNPLLGGLVDHALIEIEN
ncbi:MAG: dihydroneopterin aldolase [Saprospiraceae bacterium]|nr:dihydroneopterin aldolase [Saprospiraceae bacterium]